MVDNNRTIAQKRRYANLDEEGRKAWSERARKGAKKRHANMSAETKKKMYAKAAKTKHFLYNYVLYYREVIEYTKYLNMHFWNNLTGEKLKEHGKRCSDGRIGKTSCGYDKYHEVNVPRVIDYCGVITEQELDG